jgi:DNA repair protein RecN (Recombination protein N)
MLRALSIRNFAIIEAQELEFEAGFTAITGETGAGKSILIDALGWLLGDRADTGMIAAGQPAAELSASFELGDAQDGVRQWLEEHAMSDGDGLLLRRVVPASGSSRAWINGRSATVSQLAEVGQRLVEIHGQHEHQQLERAEVQRRLLDQQIAETITASIAQAYRKWRTASEALAEFEREAGDAAQAELLGFQTRELNALQLEDGEYEGLEAEQERLSRQDEILTAMAISTRLLDGDDEPGVRGLLSDVRHRLAEVRELDPALGEVAAMLDEAAINIDEAIAGLERMDRSDEDIGPRLDQVNKRLERALDLARKHRVDGRELPALTRTLNERLDRLSHQDDERQRLGNALSAARDQWQRAAAELHAARIKAGEDLSHQVNQHLETLGMDRARLVFSIEADERGEPRPHGWDRIAILFSGNPGQPPRPLARVASGGELSRVSLALMIAARLENGPAIRIFDEVDAGIGGQTAGVVGRFLSEVADRGQAFCVTHLAQVAACADHQLRVVKSSAEGGTRIEVEALDTEQRQEEIARMLGGTLSDKSREHAEELLKAAARASAKRR